MTIDFLCKQEDIHSFSEYMLKYFPKRTPDKDFLDLYRAIYKEEPPDFCKDCDPVENPLCNRCLGS